MTAKDKGGKHMEQMKNRKEHEAAEKFANGLADEFRAFWADEDGVGVRIGLVIIFKTQIRKLLETIFKQIETQSKEVY